MANSKARSRSPAVKRTTKSKQATKSVAKKSDLGFTNPVTEHFEFGGPVGAFFTIVLLPIVIFFLYYAASKDYKFNFSNYMELARRVPTSLGEVYSTTALVVVCAWFAFQVIIERFIFCQRVEGVVLRNGKRLSYRINGHLAFWLSFLVLGHGFPKFDDQGNFLYLSHFPLSWCYDNYIQLATASIIFSSVLSVYLYAKSFHNEAMLAEGGNTGNVVYDFFIGRELNPRIGSFDLKQFCELRPGLIGWAVLNASCALKQLELTGSISYPMLFVNLFQGLYVWDALYQEQAILTTMDITTDGFGFMLAFGDLAWVPFTYSLQARYLVENDPSKSMSTLYLAAIFTLNCLGYTIFRGANGEKDAFRRNPAAPECNHLKFLQTKRGTKLLVSGYWGMARKINYTGDWMMGLAWCLCTGFECVVTYFYAIYFFILLVHRASRDNEACEQKYGSDWPKYKKAVPYVFVPGII